MAWGGGGGGGGGGEGGDRSAVTARPRRKLTVRVGGQR